MPCFNTRKIIRISGSVNARMYKYIQLHGLCCFLSSYPTLRHVSASWCVYPVHDRRPRWARTCSGSRSHPCGRGTSFHARRLCHVGGDQNEPRTHMLRHRSLPGRLCHMCSPRGAAPMALWHAMSYELSWSWNWAVAACPGVWRVDGVQHPRATWGTVTLHRHRSHHSCSSTY